jgi:hypothetical protein
MQAAARRGRLAVFVLAQLVFIHATLHGGVLPVTLLEQAEVVPEVVFVLSLAGTVTGAALYVLATVRRADRASKLVLHP